MAGCTSEKSKDFEEYYASIRSSRFFSGVSEEELEAMLHCLDVKVEKFSKGSCILRAGDTVESIGLVMNGSVLVVQEDAWGNRNILSKFSKGQAFASAVACSPGALLDFSVMAEDDAIVMFLNVKRILTVCSSACSHHSRVVRNLLGELANKNLELNKKLGHMNHRTTRRKLLSYLSAESRRNNSREFDIPFTRQQLADYLAVDRSGLSLELGKMRDEGILDFHRNHFRLLSPDSDALWQ